MSTKLSEMFRRYYCDESGCIGHYVELLPADLVAALIAEGGEIVRWCEEHRRPSPDSVTYCNIETAKFPHFQPSCRMTERLVFPIPVESAEAKETP